MAFVGDWFGMRHFQFFGVPPPFVELSKKPGMSEVPKPTLPGWLSASPFVLITSPNFVWAVAALAVYFLAPYDLSARGTAAQAPLSLAFFAERLPLWLAVTLGYVAFWHVTLHVLDWATRPFIQNRSYNIDKTMHNVRPHAQQQQQQQRAALAPPAHPTDARPAFPNPAQIFWTTSGVVIWTGFENVFAYLWATGRLGYVKHEDTFGAGATPEGVARFVLSLMLVPVWRSVHFYFAHRLLHFGPLYQQVHSLHHRNTDIEPFAGLCMHPVEHLYYYACVLPSLVFLCSPFAFLWNGVHLLLSPAASHSGWEDHMQSDSFHYMHHR